MIKKIILVFLVLTVFSLLIFLFYKKINIKNVNCTSQYGPCPVTLKNDLDTSIGKNILDSRSKIANTLKTSSFVKNFEIKFSPPQTYNVFIIEKKGSVSFYYDNKYLVLDQENNVLTESTETNTPSIIVTGPNVPYSKLSFAAELYTRLSTKYQIAKKTISNEGLKLKIEDKEVIFPLEGNQDVILGSLELTLSWLKQGQNFTKIDLRYKNPVLR